MLFSRKFVFFIIAVVFACWAAYCYNPFALYFQNDDFTNILLSSKHELFQRNSFRPVCDLSIMLDYALFGANAAGFHFVNLILHTVATFLVYLFAKRVLALYYPGKDKTTPAAITALLFFVYPQHSESVFWVLGRSATLGCIFGLLFLLFFLRKEYTRGNVLLYLLLYAMALLTYESCWMLLPLAAILIAGMPGAGWAGLKQRKAHFAVLVVVFLVYLVFRWKQNHEVLDSYEAANFLSFNIPLLAQHFTQLILRSLTAYFETPVIITAGFAAIFIIMVLSFIKQSKSLRRKELPVIACFAISLLPCLSLGIDTHGTGGERFLYLPSVFACLFMALVLSTLQQKLAMAVTVFTCIVYSVQLCINADNYRFAGNVVRETLDELKRDSSHNIVMEGLPRAQHGAMILESGLQHATLLLGMGKDTSSIRIASFRSELNPLEKPYKTLHIPVGEDVGVARYVFTDTALVIYR